jgi:hypothetical protein
MKRIEVLEEIAAWARRYAELYEVGPARNTIAGALAQLFEKLGECEDGKSN